MSERRNRIYQSRKQRRKNVATAQIGSLLSLAFSEANHNPQLADRYSSIAWRLSTRFNVKLGAYRLFYCRECKRFIVPPHTARVRLSKKRKSLNITCLRCGGTRRKIIRQVNVLT